MKTQANLNNAEENKNRKNHEYKVSNLVLIAKPKYKRSKKAKLSSLMEGPFEIIWLYANGNVYIMRRNYDKDISIHRLRPYHTRND